MPTTLLVAPAGRLVGLTTSCLGIVRALDRQGLRVAFVKPIAGRGEDHSVELMQLGAHLHPPAPITRHVAEELLAHGDDQTLMEQVVEIASRAAKGADVLVAEGMVPEPGMVYSTRVNALMLRALDAELVLVAAPRDQSPDEVAGAVAIAARGYGALAEGRTVGVILNRICGGKVPKRKLDADGLGPTWGRCEGCPLVAAGEEILGAHRKALAAERVRAVALVPCNCDLAAPRTSDVAAALSAQVLHEGEARNRRVHDVAVCAMTVSNALKALKPGTLVVTPGDRNDVLLAAAMTATSGTRLAGVLLTGGLEPDAGVLSLCKKAFEGGLPLLSVEDGSYGAATRVSTLNPEIPSDDKDRIERTMNYVADRIDLEWVRGFGASSREPRLSPPAFRHRLIEAARADVKRIVLPEGNEPRTVTAASIVESRGIARCVLLGNPDEIRDVAVRQGVVLPHSIEIVDAAKVAGRYVEPLVERRKAKGMTAELATQELSDTIMIGTMMMALGEADGLVSGAVHTTAHTIRPALQIIKTAPGCNLVSSVFFMCLPEQVLVFGDCAVNPNPTAEQLADIAIQSADSALAFGIPARVAMLSYSTGTSGAGEEVEKVKKATEIAQQLRPELLVDGPLQYDAAVMPDVARQKAPKSKVAGQATVFVFPDLNTGNVTYKAVQRAAGVVSMGPMLQGLAKPVNDLSRGCLVEDVVFTIILTAIQAQQAARKK
ncbi:MAG TPA: phosphate acetyltransferase [Anaeromyxobacter sp.]|nr:phosphate acetyltransferase [Anaeromyxobacter sp.]